MTDLVTMPGRELMKVGKWNVHQGGEFDVTPELIQSAITAHNAAVLRKPVIRFGHNDPRFTGDPAVGWVDNVRASDDGRTLYGDLVGVPKWLAENMPSAYPSLSIEGMYDYTAPDGTTYDFILTGLGLLGATAPGISSLKSVQDVENLFSGDASGDIAAAVSEIGGTPVKFTINAASPVAEEKGATVALPEEVARRLGIEPDADDGSIRKALDEKLPETPPAVEQPKESEPQPVAAAAPEGVVQLDQAQYADLVAAAADGRAARAQQVAEDDDRIVMAAISDGRIPPARKQHWLDYLQRDREGGQQVLGSLQPGLVPLVAAGHGVASEDTAIDAELNSISARITGVPVGKDA